MDRQHSVTGGREHAYSNIYRGAGGLPAGRRGGPGGRRMPEEAGEAKAAAIAEDKAPTGTSRR